MSENYSRDTYPAFSDRIMIPIFDQNNKIVGFGARTLKKDDEQPKYINSSDSPIYKKSEVLYGINNAIKAIRKTKEAVVVEGYFDLIAAQQHGIENCVSPAGTALTEGHLRFLSSMARKVFIWYDADKGGWESAQRIGKKALDLGIPLYFINIRGGDPDEILKKPDGHSIFLREYAANKSLVEFALEINGLRGIKNPDEQYAIIKRELFDMVSASKSPLQKVLWLKAINEELGLKAPVLFQEYKHHTRTSERTAAAKPKERDVEDFVLGFLAANPAYRRLARQKFAAEDFSTNEKGLFFDFLCAENTPQGLSIKPDLHLGHGPLFLEGGRADLVREFERHYQDKDQDTGEIESTRVLHEDQLSGLESLLRETSQADKSVLDRMEAKLLALELRELDEEITRLSKSQDSDWPHQSEEVIRSYEEKLGRYNELAVRINNNGAR
jgi:DNA primase